MFDAGKVFKICLCEPFHIMDLVRCYRLFIPVLYFVYLAAFQTWVSCLIPNLKFGSFSAFHGKELGSILLRHRLKQISGFSVHTIHSVLKNFHSGERIQKVTDSPDKCGRKKEEFRIKQYPDTCGRSLNTQRLNFLCIWRT